MGRTATDLRGRRFGRLVAEYPTARRDHKGSVYWHCRCDCGKETEATEDGLIFGNNQSCGCLKRETQKRLPENLHRVDGTCVEWLEKRKSRSDNTSGFRGVYRKKDGRFRVSIGFKRQRIYLGTYETMEEAVEVRRKAEKEIHEAFLEMYRRWTERCDRDPEWGKKNPLIFRVVKGDRGTYQVITGPDMT
ncbi:MAG TPA: hypothetical protein H9717_12870 [Candidatus Eisenbergiella merdipullorum]|uniref:AP2/ERF domain-containing protein n=1 Tax=Candidatus Eisenbergiella merdipullorum TaxID=2838553 RepID=A0A9D2I9E2_9FIRM|nr:hypothetical protein [Candidatus Eisenbergiella merdipullorum]